MTDKPAASLLLKRRTFGPEVSDDLVEEAYTAIASIVKTHGEKYLPLFERLHRERQKRVQQRDLMRVALEVANSHSEHA
jgi:hypothetical protein